MSSLPLALFDSALPPVVILMAGAVLLAFTKGHLRNAVLLALPILSYVSLLQVDYGSYWSYSAFGQDLVFFRVDSLSFIFGTVFHIAAFIGSLYALHVKDNMQHVSGLVYAASAIGAVFAGDLITFLIFWEVMAVSSTFLILARRTKASNNAAMRYLLMQLISGLLMLMGIGLHLGAGGSILFTSMTSLLETGHAGPILIFLGLGVKCGWPIFHVWITDGYPASTVTGAIFLSAFTTKLAVYALARGFPGTEALIWIGTAMAVFPIFYAVIENDLRRVLCYSMINQIGYMVVGIGIGTNLSVNGAAAHAFADIIFKGLLFMAMGAVLFRTGRINGSDLGGLHRSMPWTTTFCCVGAAAISAFPLFSGFITKSMIMTAAADEGLTFVWFALLFGAAGVFHHAGIKIPFFAFFGHDSGMRPKEAPKNMLFAMGISAGLCIFIGCVPSFLYSMLPNSVDPANPVSYDPYSVAHIITQTQLLFWSALAFTTLMLLRIYPPELRSINLDADWAWRRGTRRFVGFVTGPLMAAFGWMSAVVHERIPRALGHLGRNPGGAMKLGFDRALLGWAGLVGGPDQVDRAQARLATDQTRYHESGAATTWPIGTTVLYMSIIFLLYLVLYLWA